MDQSDDRPMAQTIVPPLVALMSFSRVAPAVVAAVLIVLAVLLTRPGSGAAALVIWTDARGGGPLTVELDGRVIGKLDQYFVASTPNCGKTSGTLSITPRSGRRVLHAYDRAGRRWNSVVVAGHPCALIRLAPPGTAPGNGVIVGRDP